ncbi:thy_syn_methano, thymidylate synthase, methanogen type [uncultured Caudovirales phage]|uniref:Thy_syn_methano, thymidylate synthase, methanogen type n=1 Tax=uncultured Caudovirales phage TaxID=2100421 RepID=A0A6J5KW95_9CAUD|nr:thy_syn_methano, thymidylate synthase, methanogen type [uncultured Caudovirales phage]
MSKIYSNLHEAYLGTLADVYDNPQFVCAPRGQKVREVLDYKFVIENPVNEIIVTHDPDRNKVIASYTKKECELYNSGTNLAEDFGQASKFWLKLQNPDGTVNSAYGHLIKHKKSHGNPIYELDAKIQEQMTNFHIAEYLMEHSHEAMRTPWQWCVDALRDDKDTRQAILRFSLPEHFYKGNKDMTCTLNGNFHIREDKLYLSIYMRSNDMMLGLVYDLPWFISLMDDMIDELKDLYPNLTKGTYTHKVDSIHVYDRDEEKVLKMLGRL